jgi:hypothetical protein
MPGALAPSNVTVRKLLRLQAAHTERQMDQLDLRIAS